MSRPLYITNYDRLELICIYACGGVGWGGGRPYFREIPIQDYPHPRRV